MSLFNQPGVVVAADPMGSSVRLRRRATAVRALSIAAALLFTGTATGWQQSSAGVSGFVVAPDGMPVTGGSVALQGRNGRAITSIGTDGRFHFGGAIDGPHELHVSAPDLAPYRVALTIPRSRMVQLPVIRLSPATYLRVRPITADGEPIGPQSLRRQSFTSTGMPASESIDFRAADTVDSDGTITIGPLPHGITVITVDAPGLARTRLPDVHVDGKTPLLEGGPVVIGRGSRLQVAVVGRDGAPVPAHQVVLEDVRAFAPIPIPPARTDSRGQATFDRLAPGQYRLRTAAVDRCGPSTVSIAPIVSLSGSGISERRLVVDGTARLRLTSPHGALPYVSVSVSPEGSARTVPAALLTRRNAPLPRFESSCGQTTNAEGRAVFEHFPPGPALVRVQLPNSSYVRPILVSENGAEVVVQLPDGLLPVRVTSAATNRRLSGAVISWTGGGARSEAQTTATGDALLEGIATAGGTLQISAPGHEPADVQLAELPATPVEVTLDPIPPPFLRARVQTDAGAPIADAVVELAPASTGELGQIEVTDHSGQVMFANASRWPVVTATANGFASVTRQINAGLTGPNAVVLLSLVPLP